VKRSGLALSLSVASAFVAAWAVGALADTPPPTDTTTTTAATTTTTAQVATIATGVSLGGVAVGGMTADVATQAVQARFSLPVFLHVERTTISLDPSLVGLELPLDTAVAKALAALPGTTLPLHGTVDAQSVATFVSRLAQRFDRKPAAAKLFLRGAKPVVSPAVLGRTLKSRAAVKALTAELVSGTRVPITLAFTFERPAPVPGTTGPVIVIRRGSNLLTLYNGARYVRQFKVATGQSIYPTPLGRFQIVVMWKNPWWYPPPDPWAKGEKPTPPGPGNPLGTRWMGISAPGVGIHGTPDSASIGYSLSHGCVRMLIPQAEWLFEHVIVGTPVYIVAS
jgi:lipoprotein-anchoring transpeptidase ErfK/SrfK